MIEIGLHLISAKRALLSKTRRRSRVGPPTPPERVEPPRSVARRLAVSRQLGSSWPIYTVRPRSTSPERLVFYLHGGSYVSEITKHHWRLVADLAKWGPAEVVVPIYPLAHVATASETVPNAARLLSRFIEALGPDAVVLMGDSAGGGMALAAAEWLRNEHRPLPGRIALLSPWLDATMSDPGQDEIAPRDPFVATREKGLGKAYANGLEPGNFLVSPLFGDLSGLPPLTVFAGTRDILYTDALALVSRARAAGVPIDLHEGEGMFHDWMLFPTPEGRDARRELAVAILQDGAGHRGGEQPDRP